ncbi:MAG: acetyl-CoA carboxylase biotin carboxyl carrier protein [Phycisphaera sp.]|nr:acetyl-CoA carboxylase biotin carboxyl carrier protein [Phycisphaera sp.]
MIDLKTLKDLVKLMASNDLTELDLQDKDERITLKRGGSPQNVVTHYAPQPAAPAPTAVPAAAPNAGSSAPAPAASNADAGLVAITSPMVGTFYTAASPDAKPFVSVGDSVGPDTVVCIIEAMKVFNEIRAEDSGVIQKVMVENGQAVEFGQVLYMIKPA